MGAVVGRFSGRRKPQQQQPNTNAPAAQAPLRSVPPSSAGSSEAGPGLKPGTSYRQGRSLGPHRQLSAMSLAQRGDTLQSKSLNRSAFGEILRQTHEEEEEQKKVYSDWVRRKSIIDTKACAEHPFKLLEGSDPAWQVNHWPLQEPPASAHAPAEGGAEVGVVRVRSMGGYCCGVSSVTHLGKGKGCAVASLSGEVHLWSLTDPPPRPHLLAGKPFRLPVSALAATSKSNSLLSTVGYDHSLSVWEVLEGEGERWRGQEVGQSGAHQSVVNCVDISPCGAMVATGGGDKAVIRIWNTPTQMRGHPEQHTLTERGMLVGHWSWVTAVKFSTDSKLLFSASLDSTIRVWDVECLEPTVSMGFHDHNAVQSRSACYMPPLRSVSVNQLEQLLVNDQAEQRFLLSHKALGQQVQLCKLYDADGWGRQTEARFQYVLCETGEILYTSSGWLRTLRGHTGPVNSVQMAPDASLLASAGDDGSIILWDPQFSHNEELVLDDRFAEGTAGYHILSIEDEMIPAGASDKTAMTIPVEGGDVKLRLKCRQSFYYCKAGGGARPRNLKRCERAEGGFVERMRNPNYQILRDDGSGEVLFDWNASKTQLHGHQGPVTSLAFTPDSTHVISSSDDGTVRTWNLATLTCESVLHSPLSSFASLSVCFSPPLLLLADKGGAFHVIDEQSFDGKRFITDANKNSATEGAAH